MKELWMPWLDQGVIALLNGVLQGLLLAMFVWVMLSFFRRMNASTRYFVWMGTLGCLAAFPVIHFLLAMVGTGQDVQSTKSERSVSAQSMASLPSVETQFEESLFDVEFSQFEIMNPINSVLNLDSVDQSIDGVFLGNGSEEQGFFEEPLLASETHEQSLKGMIESDGRLSSSQEIKPKSKGPSNDQSGMLESLRAFVLPVKGVFKSIGDLTIPTRLPHWSGLAFLLCFMMGVFWNIAKLGYDLWLLKRLKHEATLPPAELNRMLKAIEPSTGMRSSVVLKTHPSLKTPLAVGFFKPMILMPEALVEVLDDSSKEQILKHELAHLLRYDDWTNLFQRLIQAVYFFHPAVWMVSRRADVEREIACDDHVLEGAGQAKAYALMLTQFANRERDRHLAAASAVWNKQSQIKERIEMLLDHHRNTAPRPARLGTGLLTVAALIVAALTFQYGPRVALADDPVLNTSDAPPATADSNSIFEEVIELPRSKSSGSPAAEMRASDTDIELLSPSSNSNASGFLGEPAPGAMGLESPESLPDIEYGNLAIEKKAQRSRVRTRTSTRPVPGTARVQVIEQAHSHPVEVEIFHDAMESEPRRVRSTTVAGHHPNALENRIARLEQLVQSLVKSAGQNESRPKVWHQYLTKRSSSSDADMPSSSSGDLFGARPEPATPKAPAAVPSLDAFDNFSQFSDIKALEFEQKRMVAEQKAMEIKHKRNQLEMQMLRLRQEMAELETEMKALENQTKGRQLR